MTPQWKYRDVFSRFDNPIAHSLNARDYDVIPMTYLSQWCLRHNTAYFAIWNAAVPNMPLVATEGVAAACLLFVAVELTRKK